jgi:hypothetical protein
MIGGTQQIDPRCGAAGRGKEVPTGTNRMAGHTESAAYPSPINKAAMGQPFEEQNILYFILLG